MTPREARLAVDIFSALVAGSIGIALAGLSWRVLGDHGQRLGAAPTAARPQRPIDLDPLIALAPFGSAAPVTTQATDQSLGLRGILLAEPRSASSALISVNGAPPIAFYIGQNVGPGTITAIEIDHVVIGAGGGQQNLAFPDRAAGGGSGAPATAPGPMMQGPMPGGGMSPPPLPYAPPVSPPAAAPPAATNGASLLSGIGAPAADGLHVGQPSDPMRQAGLQPGDVVTSINGAPAADATRNPALLGAALMSGSVQLEIMRGGQHLTLAVPLR